MAVACGVRPRTVSATARPLGFGGREKRLVSPSRNWKEPLRMAHTTGFKAERLTPGPMLPPGRGSIAPLETGAVSDPMNGPGRQPIGPGRRPRMAFYGIFPRIGNVIDEHATRRDQVRPV